MWFLTFLKSLVPRSAEDIMRQRDLLLRAANAIGELVEVARSMPLSTRAGLLSTGTDDPNPINTAEKLEHEIRNHLRGGK